jgi:hypothetical protein
MENDAGGEKLDRIISILRVAHADKISDLRMTIRSHAVDAAVIDGAQDWTSAGALQKTVAKATGQSERNVRNRIAELIALGALEKRGGGPTTMYRATGLI